MDERIVFGMVQILWGGAWADHVEETNCRSLGGVKIEDAMPAVHDQAYFIAWRWVGHIEAANHTSLCVLLFRAAKADGLCTEDDDDWTSKIPEDYAERFGNCLAYGCQGAGVSWEDDHAAFDLKLPHLGSGCDSIDLQALSGKQCGACLKKRWEAKYGKK